MLDQREAAMKDKIVQGLVLSLLVLFGLRGVLPDIIESVNVNKLLAMAAIVTVVGIIAYRSVTLVLRDPNIKRPVSRNR
jgi:succinate dehydrogenase hydrophobic anchor subunit